MNLEIRFRHMERSEALEDFVRDKISHSLAHVLHRRDAHVQVWLVSERNLVNRGTGWFVCEIDVRIPPRKDVYVQKAGQDMYAAVQAAVDRAHILLDESGKKERSRRRDVIQPTL